MKNSRPHFLLEVPYHPSQRNLVKNCATIPRATGERCRVTDSKYIVRREKHLKISGNVNEVISGRRQGKTFERFGIYINEVESTTNSADLCVLKRISALIDVPCYKFDTLYSNLSSATIAISLDEDVRGRTDRSLLVNSWGAFRDNNPNTKMSML